MSELVLTLHQPAQIGDRSRADFVLSTLDYVPGTVVRGAFAAAWLARHGVSTPGTPERGEFLRLFEGGVRFGALVLEGAEFTPLSLLSHKYRPTNCAVAEYDRAASQEAPSECPDCESPLEARPALRGAQPDRHRRTSVALHESGVALRGALFTREALNSGQRFRGTLIAPDASALKRLAEIGQVRIGGRRTTHGLAEVSIQPGLPPTAERRQDGKLIVRLRSPGIFVDPCGRPSREPDPAEISDILGTPARVIERWTRWQQVGGWHIASGLPKPGELAVAAGSTYVIDTDTHVSDEVLAVLGQRGLGLRRHEGFGDLAPPPLLEKGRLTLEEEAQQHRKLMQDVAPLKGVPIRFGDQWPSLLAALTSCVAGDPHSAERLRVQARAVPDPSVAEAVRSFLNLTPAEMAYVAEELSQL